MGGNQSQEERVVHVEQEISEDGTPRLKYTEESVKMLEMEEKEKDKIQDSSPAVSSDFDEDDEDDRYWKKQYEMEVDKNENLVQLSSEEAESTATDIQDRLTHHVPQLVPVCENLKNQVIDCYHSNPNRPLNCYMEVQEYIKCVERTREK